MFDHKHYVPILRWKRAEWVALRNLSPQVRNQLTPLLEFIPIKLNISDDSKLEENIVNTCEDINKCLGNMSAFIDLHLCPARGVKVLTTMSSLVKRMNLNLIPVVHLKQNQNWRGAVANFIKSHGVSVCVRLNLEDVERPTLGHILQQLFSDLGVTAKSVNLIIDCGVIGRQNQPVLENILSRISHVREWLTLTVISGAFPPDLMGLAPAIHTLERIDWLWWQQQVRRTRLSRIPTYGDYTIQYAIYKEPPKFSNPSASIRYTAQEHWVIMRGEGLRNPGGPGFAQYPANASLLRERPEFLGADYCEGDRYIDEMGVQVDKSGTPETWLRAGINHHLSLTVNQLRQFRRDLS